MAASNQINRSNTFFTCQITAIVIIIIESERFYPILGVEARMNDAVHIKVKVVICLVFHTCVDRDLNVIDNHRFFLHGVHNEPRIFLCEKSVEGWDSHLSIARYSKNEHCGY